MAVMYMAPPPAMGSGNFPGRFDPPKPKPPQKPAGGTSKPLLTELTQLLVGQKAEA